MTHAVRIHETGAPEVLKWEEVDVGDPGDGQVRIRHGAVGLNYIDIYMRSGLYPLENFPMTIGLEGAGTVTAVGSGVNGLDVGTRVAYAGPLSAVGAYSEERLIAADALMPLPGSIDDELAASCFLQGMTVQFLFRRTFDVGPQTTMLFHAAAGGVGLIACQWAAYLGATMIGTVGSAEKAELAKANGCTHVINYREEDFVERVKEITDGEGVDVAYDPIGQATFPASLDCIKPLGLWVSFGQASGPLPEINLGILAQKGSLFACRPMLFDYIAKRDDYEATAGELFDMIEKGHIKIAVNQTYPLKDAAQAHSDLQGRKTTGSTVLVP